MTDIDTLLRAADPGADTPDYTPAQRRDILSRAVAPAPKPSRGPLGWRIGAVAAATLTVVALGIGSLGSGATARAEAVLTEAAINAVDQPAEPGQYWKVTALIDNGECAEHAFETTYLSVDGSQPSVFVTENLGTGSDCQSLLDESTWTMTRSPNEMMDNWRWPSPAFLASLPRDVDQLRSRLLADAEGVANSPDAGVLVIAADVLTYGSAPADLRAALFGVLATLPGLDVTGEMVIDGTNVAMISLTTDEYAEQLLLDSATGNLVGFLAAAGQSERKVTYEREIVDAVPAEIAAIADVRECQIVFAEEVDPLGALACG